MELSALRNSEVVEQIQSIARDHTERVIVLDHARLRMIEREISYIQVLRVISDGHPVSDIKWSDKKETGWRCQFRRITAGNEIDVAVKLVVRDGEYADLIVTVF